jgi:Tfp pilus assembly protein PilO
MAESQQSISDKLNQYLETSQNKSYFLILVTVVFVIVMTVFGIIPAYSAFISQGVENEKRQSAIEKLSKKLEDLKSLTQESNQKEKLVNYFNYVFPERPEQEVVLKELVDISNSAGVNLQEFTFNEVSNISKDFGNNNIDPNVNALLINARLEGTQSSLTTFMSNLEQSDRIYTLRSVNIVRKPISEILNSNTENHYRLLLVLNVYYYQN